MSTTRVYHGTLSSWGLTESESFLTLPVSVRDLLNKHKTPWGVRFWVDPSGRTFPIGGKNGAEHWNWACKWFNSSSQNQSEGLEFSKQLKDSGWLRVTIWDSILVDSFIRPSPSQVRTLEDIESQTGKGVTLHVHGREANLRESFLSLFEGLEGTAITPEEAITASAIRNHETGEVITGVWHYDCESEALERGWFGNEFDNIQELYNSDGGFEYISMVCDSGFMTTKGRFLSRKDALAIARRARQIDPKMRPDDDMIQHSSKSSEKTLDPYLRAEELSHFAESTLNENPEYASYEDIDLDYTSSDAVAFGMDANGVVSVGGVDDVPKRWKDEYTFSSAMTHMRLMGVKVHGNLVDDPHGPDFYKTRISKQLPPYNTHSYWAHLGRAWHREGILLMSFWGGKPPMTVISKVASALRQKYRKPTKEIKFQYDGLSADSWVDAKSNKTPTISREQQRIAELERALHMADPSQKAFMRKGIEYAKRTLASK